MATPANATTYPVKGQLYNFSAPIKSSATGNRITGGLTGLAATISKDDGSFTSTTNAPTEIGTTGWITLDLTATEMNANKILVSITASNTNAMEIDAVFTPLQLGSFTGRWDAQTVLRFEQVWLDDLILNGINGVSQNGAAQTYFNADGSTHFSTSITQSQYTGTRSKTQ